MKKAQSVKPVIILPIILYLLQLGVNLLFVRLVNREGLLGGEEASVAFRDVFLFPFHLQHNQAATNWGGHLFYWIAQQVLGDLGLFYGRFAKAVQMAWIAPLFYLVLIRVLGIRNLIAFWASCFVLLLPGVVNYSWMATENGMECTFGLLAVLLAAEKSWKLEILSVMSAAFAALTYGAGLAFAPVVFFILAAKNVSFKTERNGILYLLFLLIVFGGVVSFPLLWWKNPARILVGGGEIPSVLGALSNVKQFFRETFYRGGSYYYFSKYPALSGLFTLIPLVSGMALSFRKRQGGWIWIGFFASLSLYVLAGREPGMRRGVPIVIFSAIFVALAVNDWIAPRWKLWIRSLAGSFLVFCLIFSSVQYQKVLRRFSQGVELPVDYFFRILPGHTMEQTYYKLLDQPELLQGTHIDEFIGETLDYEPDRVFSVLYFLSKQRPTNQQHRLSLTIPEVLQKIKIQRP